MKQIKVIKVQIYPNTTQKRIIEKTLDGCHWVGNMYMGYIEDARKRGDPFPNWQYYAKLLTGFKKNDERFMWLQGIGVKALQDRLKVIDKAFKRYFKKDAGRPQFRSKRRNPVSSYFFERNGIRLKPLKKGKRKKGFTQSRRFGRLWITALFWVRISNRERVAEYIDHISSGRIIKENNRYFIALTVEHKTKKPKLNNFGYGIDLGIKNFATGYRSTGNVKVWPNINHTSRRLKRLIERKRRLERIISNKIETNLKIYGKPEKGSDLWNKIYRSNNILRLRKKVLNITWRIDNIRKDYIHKMVNTIVKIKPWYITVETLDIKGMREKGNRHLARQIDECKWYYFRKHLTHKCKEYGIELRLAGQYFSSSKTCSKCGWEHPYLKLSDRRFVCMNVDKKTKQPCPLDMDRDLNAAINLCNLRNKDVEKTSYKVVSNK